MTYRIQPAPARVAVVALPEQTMSRGGIHIVRTHNDIKPVVGQVRAVCYPYYLDGREMVALFAEGDIVVFGKYSGTEVQVDRETFIVLDEKDILATLEEEAEGEQAQPRV